MIRRRKLTERQRQAREYKRQAPIGTGESQDERKTRAAAVEAAVIQAVHDFIWHTRSACQLCHGRRRDECAGFPDEMHEDPPRSATRGKPPWERFNIKVCGRLCKACHRDVTENRLTIRFSDPALKFMRPVTAEVTHGK